MRVQVLSDLHFELHRDGGNSFVASLDPEGVDVLVVAGDLAVADGIHDALDLLCGRFARSVVVYVHGNHEVYGTTHSALRSTQRRAQKRLSRLRWLDCEGTTVGGVRFLGAPLWFPRPVDVESIKDRMNDFSQIVDFESWVYAENARARKFLEAEVRPSDIVVTHHLPTMASVAERWRGSPLNVFFVSNEEALIRAREPAVWIHGHTHDSVDLVVHRTRIVCNPFGYARYEENRSFDPRKVLVV